MEIGLGLCRIQDTDMLLFSDPQIASSCSSQLISIMSAISTSNFDERNSPMINWV
jgi:hypothetical protein